LNYEDIFSYSSKDKAFVTRLIEALKKREVDVWFDEHEIQVGDSIIEKINDGLKEMDGLAIILSQNSINSDWVKKELNTALMRKLSQEKVKIFPIRVDNCEIPLLISEYKYADFRNDFEKGLKEFIQSTGRKLVAPDKKESPSKRGTEYHKKMYEDCYSAFREFERYLLVMSEAILKAWHKYAIEKDGPNLYKPLNEEIKEQMAEHITETLISDKRNQSIPQIEWIKNLDSPFHKSDLASQVLYFSKQIFLGEKQPWSFVVNLDFSRNNYVGPIYPHIFNEIIPSQFVWAISRFIIAWTSNVNLSDADSFFEYLKARYSYMEIKDEELNNWRSPIDKFRELVILERLGLFSPTVLDRGAGYMMVTDKIMYYSINLAFNRKDPFAPSYNF